jgi:hypothetical protein
MRKIPDVIKGSAAMKIAIFTETAHINQNRKG